MWLLTQEIQVKRLEVEGYILHKPSRQI